MEKNKPGNFTWLINIDLVIHHLDENKIVDNFNVLGSAELSALLTIKRLCKWLETVTRSRKLVETVQSGFATLMKHQQNCQRFKFQRTFENFLVQKF